MKKRTSFLVTGLSTNTKCVNRLNPANTSRSASCAIWFDASTSCCRFGTALGSDVCMLATRLCASSSVERRVESGKLPRTWMSLSVKSMESWGCCIAQLEQTVSQRNKNSRKAEKGRRETHACDTQILNRRDSMSYSFQPAQDAINSGPQKSVVSAPFTQNAPRRSSSRSLSGLR